MEQATDSIVAVANTVERPKQIVVKIKNTKGKTENVTVTVESTVRELKRKVALLPFNVPAHAQRLVFGKGTILEDNARVCDTGLKDKGSLMI